MKQREKLFIEKLDKVLGRMGINGVEEDYEIDGVTTVDYYYEDVYVALAFVSNSKTRNFDKEQQVCSLLDCRYIHIDLDGGLDDLQLIGDFVNDLVSAPEFLYD